MAPRDPSCAVSCTFTDSTLEGGAQSSSITLHNFTNYSLTVATHITQAVSPSSFSNESSPAINATPTAGAPGAVTGQPKHSQVDLSWTQPGYTTGLVGYVVTANPGAIVQCTTTFTLGNPVTYSFTGLVDGTAYTFAVQAFYGGTCGAPQFLGTSSTSAALVPTGIEIDQLITVDRPQGALVLTQACDTRFGGSPYPVDGVGVPLSPSTLYPTPASQTGIGGPTSTDYNPSGIFPAVPGNCTIDLGHASFVASAGVPTQAVPGQSGTPGYPSVGEGQFFKADGALSRVAVVDTRDTDAGWTVSGLMKTDFYASATKHFSAHQLGWQPGLADKTPNFATPDLPGGYSNDAARGGDVLPATTAAGHGPRQLADPRERDRRTRPGHRALRRAAPRVDPGVRAARRVLRGDADHGHLSSTTDNCTPQHRNNRTPGEPGAGGPPPAPGDAARERGTSVIDHGQDAAPGRRRARPPARPLRTMALGALVLLVTALGSLPASAAVRAQTDPSPAQPSTQVVESWALTPVGVDPSQPGNRPAFSYNLAPGAVQDDALTVWNYGDTQMTYRIYATDALNNVDGGFDLLKGEATPKDVGSWISIEQNNLTLPAHSKATLKLRLTVPADATPGDHTAGIVAASTTPGINAEGKHLILDRRTGSRVYLRVAGPTNPGLTVENLSTDYHPSLNPLDGSLDVTYTVRNSGNVRLGAHQTIAVKDLLGTVSERTVKDLPELLPGNQVTVTEHFGGVAATVRVGADVTLKPFIPKSSGVAVDAKLQTTTSSTKTWAIPWLLLLVLLLLVAGIWWMRRRRARSAGGAPGQFGPDDGAGGPGTGDGGMPTARPIPVEPVGAGRPRSSTGGMPLR